MKLIKYLFVGFCAITSFSSCKNSSEKIEEAATESQTNQNSENLPRDTFNFDPNSFYFLAHLTTDEFAKLYLTDSIYTNDYKKLYDCLDSLSSDNENTRDFYETVLIHAINDFEAVFHQSMAPHLIQNTIKFPEEFVKRISKMNEYELRLYAQGFVGIDAKHLAQNQQFYTTLNHQVSIHEGLIKNKIETILSIIEDAKSPSFE